MLVPGQALESPCDSFLLRQDPCVTKITVCSIMLSVSTKNSLSCKYLVLLPLFDDLFGYKHR